MKTSLAFLRMMLGRPRNRADAVYSLLSTRNNLGEKSLYLNLGYWEKADSYDEACDALADLLAEAAGMGPADEVLDVGFGFGDQDLRWASTIGPKRIVGVNITASQVDAARRRVALRGLQGKIELVCASATALPFPDGSFDKVTALETAFHYDTREDFFREAFRVLRPGGRLALADIVPLRDPAKLRWHERIGETVNGRFWQIPSANLYPWPQYERKLAAIGFRDAAARSIRDQVYPPFARYARRRLAEPEIAERLDGLVRLFWKASVAGMGAGNSLDYLIVTADK